MNPGEGRKRSENLEGAAKFRQLASPTNMVQQHDREGSRASKFPVRLSTTHPMDEQMALRQSVVNRQGVVEGLGIATVGEREFQYQADKLSDAQEAEYKQWVMSNIDLSNPASQAWYFKTLPWIKTDREAEVDRISDLQKSWAKIMMNGPTSDEDWRMYYAVDQGILKIPDVPVHRLADMSGTGPEFATSYKKGFFSVFAQKTSDTSLPMQQRPKGRLTWGDPRPSSATGFSAGQWSQDNFARNPKALFTGNNA